MGCFCLKSDEPKTRTYDCTPPGDNFECLRPQGTINLSIDRKYNIPIVENLMAGMKRYKHLQSLLRTITIKSEKDI